MVMCRHVLEVLPLTSFSLLLFCFSLLLILHVFYAPMAQGVGLRQQTMGRSLNSLHN
jgi:hypothetical protein